MSGRDVRTFLVTGCALASSLVVACTVWNGVVLPTDDAGARADGSSDASTAGRYAAEVTRDAPLAYWRFAAIESGTTSLVRDVTGHGKVCTLSSGATLTDGAFPGARAVHVGEGDEVVCSKSNEDDFAFPGRAPFSIEAFCALDARGPLSTSEYHHLFDRMAGDSPSNRRGYYGYLRRDANESAWTFAFEIWQGDGGLDFVGGNLAASFAPAVWIHFAITRDSSGAEAVYVDGKLLGQGVARDTPRTTNVRLVVGTNQNGSCCSFKGNIGELAVFDKALLPEDVTRHVAAARLDGFVTP